MAALGAARRQDALVPRGSFGSAGPRYNDCTPTAEEAFAMRFLQWTRSVSRFQSALLAVYSTCVLILAANARNLPTDGPEGPWLPDSIGIVGKDIEVADLPEHDTDSEHFAYVTDADSGTVLSKAFVGQAWVATDFRYHLRVPLWTPGCTEVLFHDERYFQPVTVTPGEKADAATNPEQSKK